MTIQMASQCLGKSESTIRRWIKAGKFKATIVDGVYDISEQAIKAYSNDQLMNSQPVGDDKALIDQLTKQLEQKALMEHKETFWKRLFRKK